MPAVSARARADLRRRWRAWLGLALLVGVAGGIVMSMVAGGRRAESAYDRFLAETAPSDVHLLDGGDFGFSGRVDLSRVAELPAVEDVSETAAFFMPVARSGGATLVADDFLPVVSLDGRLGSAVDRQRILAGRAADPDRPDEAVLNFLAADALGLEPGDEVEVVLVPEDSFREGVAEFLAELPDRVSGRDPSAAFADAATTVELVEVRIRVVGVVAVPGGFPPLAGDNSPFLYLTPAFGRAHGDELVHQGSLHVRLRAGASVADFKGDAERVAGVRDVPFIYTREDHARAVNRSIHFQALALWALAGLVGAAAVVVLAQLIGRQATAEAGDHPSLRALGFTRAQLVGLASVRVAVEAVVAVFVAIAVAVGLSATWSSGVVRRAEPDPGPFVDRSVLALGATLTAVFLVAAGLAAAWRTTRSRRSRTAYGGRYRLTLLLGRLPLPVPVDVGIRHALDAGQPGRRASTGSAVFMLAAAVAAFSVSVTFDASLDGLVGTPERFGWGWEVQLGGVASPDIPEPIIEGLRDNPAVSDVAVGAIGQLAVQGQAVNAYALDDIQGEVAPVLLEGRAPRRPDEIALGTVTLRAIDAHVGDEVPVAVGGVEKQFRIVGRAVFPNIGDRGQLGTGARVTWQGYRRLVPDPPRNTFLVAFEPGVDAPNMIRRLHRALDPYSVIGAEQRAPTDLVNLGQSDRAPVMAAGALALLVVATLVHVLAMSARRRRAEYATLRTLGFRTRDLVSTFAGQSLTVSVTALVLGLPLGVAAGRWCWILVAGQFGFEAHPEVPIVPLSSAALGLVVLGALVALGPGWAAARRHPAVGLRSK